MSGVPQRLKSTRVPSAACVDLPASSSRWTRVMPTVFAPPSSSADLERAAGRQRPVVLGDLVSLREVGIEVVLPREDRARMHLAAERDRGAHGELHRARVQHRQRARVAEADRADLRVRRRAVRGRAAAEDLARGRELDVDLEADDGLVALGEGLDTSRCASRSSSSRIWRTRVANRGSDRRSSRRGSTFR